MDASAGNCCQADGLQQEALDAVPCAESGPLCAKVCHADPPYASLQHHPGRARPHLAAGAVRSSESYG
jgi:hypothetical protein